MILRCSRGHTYDTSHPLYKHLEEYYQPWSKKTFGKFGKRCPMEMSYDRIGGSSYCGRILRRIDNEKVS